MDWSGIAAVLAGIVSLISLIVALKKSHHENHNIDADTDAKRAQRDKLYQEIADRWAEHVEELQGTITKQAKLLDGLEAQGKCDRSEITGLRLDIQQVRRDNESYRLELAERDEIISDLKIWAEQLMTLLKEHAPSIAPPGFMRRKKIT